VIDLALDNDVLIKTSIYGNGRHLLHHCCGEDCNGENVILLTAKWVCRRALEHHIRDGRATLDAQAYFEEMLCDLVEVEPSAQEISLAAELEERALELGLELDTGESQLAAFCAIRGGTLVTGDKRAIAALQAMLPAMSELDTLRGSVACLEQAIGSIVAHTSGPAVRAAICSVPATDRSLTSAMECSMPPGYFSMDGLESYINDLRSRAADMLAAGTALCSAS